MNQYIEQNNIEQYEAQKDIKFIIYMCISLNINNLYLHTLKYDDKIQFISIVKYNSNWYLYIIEYDKIKSNFMEIYKYIHISETDISTIFNFNKNRFKNEFEICIPNNIYCVYKSIIFNKNNYQITFDKTRCLLFEKNEIYDNCTYNEIIEIASIIDKNFVI